MKTHQLKLVDSTYSVKEAKKVVLSLLNDKIKFLNYQIFSLSERFGEDTTHLKNRRKELNNERELLIETLNQFKDEDYQIEIDCAINLHVKKAALV